MRRRATRGERRRVDVVTEDFGIMPPEQTGLPCAVQTARVVVSSNAQSRSHVVVRVASAPWTTSLNIDQPRTMFTVDIVWPQTTFFGSIDDWLERGMRPDHEDFTA